jgi:histone deacetylase 11
VADRLARAPADAVGDGGTLLAARHALIRGGVAFNLSGGYHHASPSRGEGFSVYADVGVAIAVLRRDGLLGESDRVLYIDLDAHQGNGVARAFARDPTLFIFDLYNSEIYPHDTEARRRIDCDVPVTTGYDDGRYLGALRHELPAFLDFFKGERKPKLAFYNAGTDVLVGDPLGWMCVSARGVLERDRYVLEQLAERDIPCAMMTSGGYTRTSYELVAGTAAWLVESALGRDAGG